MLLLLLWFIMSGRLGILLSGMGHSYGKYLRSIHQDVCCRVRNQMDLKWSRVEVECFENLVTTCKR